MFTINELQDKQADYKSTCHITIKQFLSDSKYIKFDINDDLNICPSLCFYYYGIDLIEGIIQKVSIDNDDIIITFVDKNDNNFIMSDKIQHFIYIDYINLINTIKNFNDFWMIDNV